MASEARRHSRRRLPAGLGLAALAVLALAAAGCGGSGEEKLTVSAASSLTGALTSYGESFAGAEVRESFAGSDQLAAQIRQGARPDVFASADTEYPAQLHREGLVEKPVVFARNRLVAIVPAESEATSLADLAAPGTKIAIGDASVPVGIYTRDVLAQLPAAERGAILANVRSEEPAVSSVVAKVAGGGADAGFAYATDVAAAGGRVTAIPIPARMQPDLAYAAAVVSGAGQPALARRYLDGLLHGRGAALLRRAGFLPP